jgi:rod shape-determining protein MreC
MYKRIFIFVFIACLLLAAPFTVSRWLRDKASHVLAPVARPFQGQRIAVSNFFTNISQIGTLRSDKESLQQDIVNLEQQVSTLEELKRENENLKKELGVTGIVKEMPKVFAHIIIQGTDLLDRTFTIDVGSSQGVRLGQPVVSEGYLVGRVIEVRGQSSQVRSILSSRSIIQAWLPTIGDKGLLVGEGNTVSLQKISQGKTVAESSLIETSGLAEEKPGNVIPIPQGILIGKTTTSLSKASDLTQSFRVELGNDPSRLESVFVLLVDTP